MQYLKLFEKYHQELNENFYKWFNESKIVDDSGKALLMYHGSPHFGTIKTLKKFESEKGYYFFTSEKDEALRYTQLDYPQLSKYRHNKLEYNKAVEDYNKEEDKRIQKFYIKCENPFDSTKMSDKEKKSIINLINKNKDILIKELNSESDIITYALEDLGYEYDEISENEIEVLEYCLINSSDNYLLLEHTIIQDWIKSNGYDGFYTIESGWGVNVAIYSNNQIKSVNNNGNWTDSENIYENKINELHQDTYDSYYNKRLYNMLVRNHKEIIDHKNINISNISSSLEDILIFISNNGDLDALKLLIDNGEIDISYFNNYAIRIASSNGHTEMVKYLLSIKGVNPSDLDNYAIRMASKNKHIGVVKELAKNIIIQLIAGMSEEELLKEYL